MPTYSKPHGDFQNLTQTADATQVNDQINQLYTAMNGGLDVANVPTLGDVTTLATTAKSTAVAAINEINANYPISAMSRQALINGNFDIWQRGTSFTNPANGTYTADRWKVSNNLDGGTFPNLTLSRQQLTTGDIANAFYHFRLTTDGAGSGFGVNAGYDVRQVIENGTRYLCGSGKKVTVSFWARSSIANKRIGINLVQNYGTGGSPTAQEFITGQIINLTATWAKYTVTFTTNTLVGKTFGTNSDDALSVVINMLWGTNGATTRFGGGTAETFVGAGNIDIAQVPVNAGDQALLFQPRSFAEELALCQRYYWKTFSYNVAPVQNAADGNGALGYIVHLSGASYDGVLVKYPVKMRTIPTVTTYNPQAANSKWRNTTLGSDSGSAAINQSNESGCIIVNNPQVAGDAVSNTILIHATADAEL